MAEILALGISHYPPSPVPDERMTWILKRMLQIRIFRSAQNPPAGPSRCAPSGATTRVRRQPTRHRADLVGWLEKTRAALDAFKPDFILMWGDDQYETSRRTSSRLTASRLRALPFTAPAGNVWGETDKTLTCRDTACRQDADQPADRGRLRHRLCLQAAASRAGHAFTNAAMYLDYGRKGFDYPIVPSPSTATADGFSPSAAAFLCSTADRRCRPRSAGAHAQAPVRPRRGDGAHSRRVALPGGAARLLGMVARLPDRKNHFLYPDTPADRRCTTRCAPATGRAGATARPAVEDSGQQEILNWMCLAGALSELKRKPAQTGFVEPGSSIRRKRS